MRVFALLFFFLITTSGYAQFGISYHQSNLPFVGFNYEINNRFVPELRIGMDNYIDNLSIEAVGTYQFIDNDDVEVYAGAGFRAVRSEGLVAPIGLNIFPFPAKKFGFHIEVSPIFQFHDDVLVRGSWGIRYRFLQ
jgi:hypothetical protein